MTMEVITDALKKMRARWGHELPDIEPEILALEQLFRDMAGKVEQLGESPEWANRAVTGFALNAGIRVLLNRGATKDQILSIVGELVDYQQFDLSPDEILGEGGAKAS